MYKKSIDTTLVFLVIALLIFGMIMISSVSVYPSFNITSQMVNRGILSEPNNYYFLIRNIIHVSLGIVLLVIFSKLSYTLFEKYSKVILALSFGALIGVLIFGVEYNGSRGWLDISGLPFSVQPVEFVKIGLLMYLAFFIKRKKHLIADFHEGSLPYFLIVSAIFGLLMLQPDFGSVLIIAPVVIALYYVGGGNVRHLFILLLLCFVGAFSIYLIGKFGGENFSRFSYISGRVDNFFQDNETLFTKKHSDGKDYQIKQGLIAIGSSGFFGLGFGKSIQKYGYLPEVQGDFVFSVIVEELGFLGAFVLLSTYLIIVHRAFTIARFVKDPFGKYFASGVGILILVQVFVNVGVNLNVVPLTGVTLPFVSYGGSSLISLMIAIGILLNISRYMEYHPGYGYEFFKRKRIVM